MNSIYWEIRKEICIVLLLTTHKKKCIKRILLNEELFSDNRENVLLFSNDREKLEFYFHLMKISKERRNT